MPMFACPPLILSVAILRMPWVGTRTHTLPVQNASMCLPLLITQVQPFALLLHAIQPGHRARVHRVEQIAVRFAEEAQKVGGAARARLPAVKIAVQVGQDHQHVVRHGDCQVAQIRSAAAIKQVVTRQVDPGGLPA